MILVALGANIPSRFGSPEDTLREALRVMARQGVAVRAASSLWLTAPVPVSDQPWYRNAVVAVEAARAPLALFEVLKSIEADFGRESAARNAPRVVDLDILTYDDVVMGGEVLTLPHPRMEGRAFVLYPLREVAPGWRHPVSGRSVDELITALGAVEGVERQAALAA